MVPYIHVIILNDMITRYGSIMHVPCTCLSSEECNQIIALVIIWYPSLSTVYEIIVLQILECPYLACGNLCV